MPTIGRLSGRLPVEPQNGAPPNEKMPPSRATIQYPLWVCCCTHDGGSGTGGACGGGPDGPANAVTPAFVPMRRRPSAADGDAKWGTVPSAIVVIVAPVAGFSA